MAKEHDLFDRLLVLLAALYILNEMSSCCAKCKISKIAEGGEVESSAQVYDCPTIEFEVRRDRR